MATKKHKKANATSKSAKQQQQQQQPASGDGDQASSNTTAAAGSSSGMPVFKSPQLNALILLSIGVSRILQVRSTFAVAGEAAPVCVQHLNEAACLDDTILSLLKYKFGVALQLTIVAIACILQCWNTEPVMTKLNALFAFTPMLTGVQALHAASIIDSKQTWAQLWVALVLFALCAPTSLQALPFTKYTTADGVSSSSFSYSKRTLPALVLMGLTVLYLAQAANFLLLGLPERAATPTHLSFMEWVLPVQPAAVEKLEGDIADAATPILYFLAVDAFTVALLLAFAWFTLPDRSQRVSVLSYCNMLFIFLLFLFWIFTHTQLTKRIVHTLLQSILMMVAASKSAEVAHQLPAMERDANSGQLFQLEHMKSTALTVAFVAGVAWIVPDISFQKKKRNQ